MNKKTAALFSAAFLAAAALPAAAIAMHWWSVQHR